MEHAYRVRAKIQQRERRESKEIIYEIDQIQHTGLEQGKDTLSFKTREKIGYSQISVEGESSLGGKSI